MRPFLGGPSQHINLGGGPGYSVHQVIETVELVSGEKIQVQVKGRRAGDPARLVADSHIASQLLGWAPQYKTLAEMIGHAWHFELQHLQPVKTS